MFLELSPLKFGSETRRSSLLQILIVVATVMKKSIGISIIKNNNKIFGVDKAFWAYVVYNILKLVTFVKLAISCLIRKQRNKKIPPKK